MAGPVCGDRIGTVVATGRVTVDWASKLSAHSDCCNPVSDDWARAAPGANSVAAAEVRMNCLRFM
jgi:hypothetical protein